METLYLTATFKKKDRVKALGARFDPIKKQGCIPSNGNLEPFKSWLPQEYKNQLAKNAVEFEPAP